MPRQSEKLGQVKADFIKLGFWLAARLETLEIIARVSRLGRVNWL